MPGKKLYFLLFLILLFHAACSPSLSPVSIEEAIRDHFKSRNLEVVSMEIGGIRSQSLGEKRYMGTNAVHVSLKSLSLRPSSDASGVYSTLNGGEMHFSDVVISLKEERGTSRQWTVINMKGIPLL